MKIRILFFASVADAARSRQLDLEVEPGTSVGGLRKRLERERPGLAGRLGKCAAAVNQAVAGPETVLSEEDEVAFLPPVSGGAR
ncbi:MAG: molybdopterin converting factor subunit 1 [Candidatus Brocadiae bacterium]|nr:molybdopterin converting factor subunit 1 [Candidatus Brocadiia bacterium]